MKKGTFPRSFPIMSDEIKAIPWDVIAPHEATARANHDQSLQTLAGRGGLSPCEAVAVLEDRKWRKMPEADAVKRLRELWLGEAWERSRIRRSQADTYL